MIDRKRKFLDTDLAHDSEGSEAFPWGCGFLHQPSVNNPL